MYRRSGKLFDKKNGRPPKYDHQKIIVSLRSDKTNRQIAEENGCHIDTVRWLRRINGLQRVEVAA